MTNRDLSTAIAAYLAKHPRASDKQCAAAVGCHPSTVYALPPRGKAQQDRAARRRNGCARAGELRRHGLYAGFASGFSMGGEMIRRILSAITRKPPQIVIAPGSKFAVRAMRINNRNAKAAALYVRVHEILTEGRK